MKLTKALLAMVMMTAAAVAQNPAVDDTHSNAKSPQQTNGTNAALGTPAAAQKTKPTAGAPAPAVKPAVIPAAKPVVAKAEVKPGASMQSNLLEGVSVNHNGGDVQIEISARESVTPKVSKLSLPARVVVELPATAMAKVQNKIAVGSNGVKGVRIGMDGKTPPTTSVVVDLDQQTPYDLSQGAGNSFILTLHTQAAAAKNTPAPVKPAQPAPKLQATAMKPQSQVSAAKPSAPALQSVAVKSAPAPVVGVQAGKKNSAPSAPASQAKPSMAPATVAAKAHDAFAPKMPAPAPVTAKVAPAATPKAAEKVPANTKVAASTKAKETVKPAEPVKIAATPAVEPIKTAEAPKPPKPEEKKWAMTGTRDPFNSPIVQQQGGSGCSTGKKCLEIGQINVKGVVRSDNGFIAVVTNSLNKAYFLHENDPVFNGFVMRITGDSVVFQETVQDKFGKPFTREVVKRIVTPAV
jgi:Tfp pilus assembly protein PilP